jgi:hypothetical protein
MKPQSEAYYNLQYLLHAHTEILTTGFLVMKVHGGGWWSNRLRGRTQAEPHMEIRAPQRIQLMGIC